LTGALTLNDGGVNGSVFIFQIGSTLTTASASSVLLTGGGTGDSIFWEIGSSATLGTTTAFEGNILAETSITLNTGATITCGSALAHTGAVTMDTNTISIGCAGPLVGGASPLPLPPGPPTTFGVPEPSTILLFGLGFAGLGFGRRKKS
jgi:hypothetical protein